jgi:N12 class adenine-specific DNA methylase
LEAELLPDDVNLPKNTAIDYDLEKAFEDVVKRQNEQQKILEIKNLVQSKPPLQDKTL